MPLLSRIAVNASKYSPRSRRLQIVMNKNLLTRQRPNFCVFDHSAVVKAASEFENARMQRIVRNPVFGLPRMLTKYELIEEVKKHPILMQGRNIAHKDSKYIGHHAIAIIDYLEEENQFLVVDRDDTINTNSVVFLCDPDEVADNLQVHVDESAAALDPYERPYQPMSPCVIL